MGGQAGTEAIGELHEPFPPHEAEGRQVRSSVESLSTRQRQDGRETFLEALGEDRGLAMKRQRSFSKIRVDRTVGKAPKDACFGTSCERLGTTKRSIEYS